MVALVSLSHAHHAGAWQKEASEEGDGGGGDSGEGSGGRGGGVDHKMRDDMELVLAALVDFRRDMKALNKRVQQMTDTDGHKSHHTTTKHNPGFLE